MGRLLPESEDCWKTPAPSSLVKQCGELAAAASAVPPPHQAC